MTVILDGKKTAAEIEKEIALQVKNGLRPPHLAVVLAGENPASKAYVGRKEKKAKELGFSFTLHKHDANLSEAALLALLSTLNQDETVDGILVQLPLPPQIHPKHVIEALDPSKDVDGFHPLNLGKMVIGDSSGFIPCTPLGVCELLKRNHIDLEGKKCVIIGRSLIVGRPLSILLSAKEYGWNATVTVAHSQSKNLSEITSEADCLICAAGTPGKVGAGMVKEGAVVVDVGTSRVEDPSHPKGYRIAGDADFKTVSPKVHAISPVPGGVGPMTIALLMQNTLKAYAAKTASVQSSS